MTIVSLDKDDSDKKCTIILGGYKKKLVLISRLSFPIVYINIVKKNKEILGKCFKMKIVKIKKL